MTVKELILQLLERPMSDHVVFHRDGENIRGHWSDLEEQHVRQGIGITIIDLEEKRQGP
jgi:hypothetical protein